MQMYIKGDIVYKFLSERGYLLKMSPWEPGEDRRVFNFDLSEYKKINTSKAQAIINNQWDRDKRIWEYDGTMYFVYDSLDTDYQFTYKEIRGKTTRHEFHTTWKDFESKIYKCISIFYLCMHQGKVYWMTVDQYYPQARLYKFTDINTKPDSKDFVKWTKVTHCKKIYKTNPFKSKPENENI